MHNMRKNTGPMISRTLPLQQTETFDYDAMGRLLKHKDALGNETTKEYHIAATGNWEKTKTPGGYITIVNYDALGREISKQDNGDPTDPHKPAIRYLSKKEYDSLSRVVTSTDTLGLTTRYTYDSVGRPLSVIDAQQNVINYKYDDVNMQVTQDLGGDRRTIQTLDGRMRVVKLVKYPDSGDDSVDYCVEEQTVYDGADRIVAKTLSQKPKSNGDSDTGPVMLQSESVAYGPESTILSRKASGLGVHGVDTIQRDYTYDPFGNIYNYTKTVSYASAGSSGNDKNHVFRHKGAHNVYDANNRLAMAYDQEGGVEKWSYNANGWLQNSTRLDGSITTYVYDKVGRNIKTIYPSQVTKSAYDVDGRLVQVMQGKDVMLYQYAVDGTLTEIIYPDQSTQSYRLDQFSRVVESIDAVRTSTSTSFNQYGDVSTVVCQGDRVSYTYATVNHTNGKLVASALEGSQNYTTHLTYDGFDRLRNVASSNSNSSLLLNTTYVVDATGKLRSYVSTSQVNPSANESRQYSYDGLNQVVSDTTGQNKVTLYSYDANSNVIQVNEDGWISKMTYNGIDQRTDSGFVYDQNGRLLNDGAGRRYTFDDKDQLVRVQVDTKTSWQFTYYPNDLLEGYMNDSDSTQMYYSGGKTNAMRVTQRQQPKSHSTSIFRDTKSIIANYTDGRADTYFLERHGSSALLLAPPSVPTAGEAGSVSSRVTYGTYGAATTSSALSTQSSFGYRHEFFDQASGLVYLRSRYYHPEQRTFISMDTYRDENRYAYCKGDPINLIDADGRLPSWLKKVISGVAGLVMGIAVGALASWALGPVIGVAAAGIVGSAIGGAAGNVMSGFVSAKLSGRKYTGQQILIDGLVGGIAGAAGAAAGAALGPALAPLVPGQSFKFVGGLISKNASSLAGKAIGGVVSTAEKALLKPIVAAEVHTAWSLGSSIRHGDPTGITQTIASGRKSVLSPQALATVHAAREGAGRHVETHQRSVKDAVYHPLTFESPSTASGSGGATSTATAAFDKSFSTSHDWTPSSMAHAAQAANQSFGGQWKDWSGGGP